MGKNNVTAAVIGQKKAATRQPGQRAGRPHRALAASRGSRNSMTNCLDTVQGMVSSVLQNDLP